MNRLAIMFAVTLFAIGCKKDKSEGPAAEPPPVTATAVDSAGPAAGEGDDPAAATDPSAAAPLDIPTEVDFEDDVASEITEKNVAARLKALEDDLGE